jgi:hypothetical protein
MIKVKNRMKLIFNKLKIRNKIKIKMVKIKYLFLDSLTSDKNLKTKISKK